MPNLLTKVDPIRAIHHALREAHDCIQYRHYCGALSLLRKVVDLWSGLYRDKHGMAFNREAGESDNVYWRLKKIADENKIYRDALHDIIDGLRLNGNGALHDPTICVDLVGTYDGISLANIKAPYERLFATTAKLVELTQKGLA